MRMEMMMRVLWLAAVLMSSGVVTQRVDMNNALLTHIPTNASTGLNQLILSHNSIEMSISDINALRRYPRVRELDLSYNLIQTLPPGAFDNLTNIEILKLRGNRLKTLDKDIFKALGKLKSLDLEDNPWECSCSLSSLIKQLNDSGISIGEEVTCDAPQKTSILDGNSFCSIQATTVKTSLERSRSTPLPTIELRDSSHVNSTSKEFIASGGTLTGSSSWKFLLGVVVLTLGTSMLIVCAVKSPSWYKLLFNYRHQRLHEDVEHNTFNTGRFSNFSLDTEQTETSAQELDEGLDPGLSLQPFEDDDGFIEDGYIDPGNYSEPVDAKS